MNTVNFGSDDYYSSVRGQVNTWNNAGLLSTGRVGTIFSEILKYTKFHSGNTFENVVWKMVVILFSMLMQLRSMIMEEEESMVERKAPWL